MLAGISLCASLGFAQKKKIVPEPMRQTSPASGRGMYLAYCAACHGKMGEGNGPAASVLKSPPPNLTTLAERHGGKFPVSYVRGVLEFGAENPAHGSREMPIWGTLFRSLPGNSKAQVSIRISNLIHYLEKLQKEGKEKKQ